MTGKPLFWLGVAARFVVGLTCYHCGTMRVVGILLTLAQFAYGCSCIEASQSESFRYAKAVFDGTVIDVQKFEPQDQRAFVSRVLVTFKVSKQRKGSVHSTIKVPAVEPNLMCGGYSFLQQERYVVYAMEIDSEFGWADQYPSGSKILSIGDCVLRVQTGNKISAESKLLGKSKSPVSN